MSEAIQIPAVWFPLVFAGIMLGLWFMHRLALRSARNRLIGTIGVAVIVFLIGYLGAAFYRTSIRYSNAFELSKRQAHTIVGKEGYEYIFEPNTQIFIDRIKPNGSAIVFYIVRKFYLPSLSGADCTFPDPEICKWISLNLYFGPDQRDYLWRIALFSSILGLISAGGFYLLTRPPKDVAKRI